MKMREQVRSAVARSWFSGLLALGFALAGCGGFGSPDSNTMTISLASLTNQMSDRPANSPSPQSVSGPGATSETTDVKTIILGAIVINFQNTPLGPNTAISKNLEDALKTAAEESVAFITIVQLPSSDASVPVILPPPETPNWQIVAVGTQNTVNQLTDINENSPVYYGFNVDMNGNPFFISSKSPPATVNVTMVRACIAPAKPNGCAQYDPDGTLVITPALEVVGVYVNGSTSNSLAGGNALPVENAGQVAAAATAIGTAAGALTPGKTVRIDTTHQLYPPTAAANPTCAAALAGALYGTAPGVAGTSTCVVESYTTTF